MQTRDVCSVTPQARSHQRIPGCHGGVTDRRARRTKYSRKRRSHWLDSELNAAMTGSASRGGNSRLSLESSVHRGNEALTGRFASASAPAGNDAAGGGDGNSPMHGSGGSVPLANQRSLGRPSSFQRFLAKAALSATTAAEPLPLSASKTAAAAAAPAECAKSSAWKGPTRPLVAVLAGAKDTDLEAGSAAADADCDTARGSWRERTSTRTQATLAHAHRSGTCV